MWWGCYSLCLRHWPAKLAHSVLFCSCVCLCFYGPFNCISFHTFSRQLCFLTLFFRPYLCLIGCFKYYISLWKSSFNPDIILVPVGSPSCGGDVTVHAWHKPTSLPTPFYSVLVSVSVFMALSTVFHSIHSPDNSVFFHSVVLVLSLPNYNCCCFFFTLLF